jgi:hypothetical protein
MTCTTILTVEPVHTGPTAGICGGAVLAAPGVADNGGPHECPPQPFWTGVAMAPCFTSFPTRWTYSPHRFMQVPTNADFRSLSDSHVFGTVLHERTLKVPCSWLRGRAGGARAVTFGHKAQGVEGLLFRRYRRATVRARRSTHRIGRIKGKPLAMVPEPTVRARWRDPVRSLRSV